MFFFQLLRYRGHYEFLIDPGRNNVIIIPFETAVDCIIIMHIFSISIFIIYLHREVDLLTHSNRFTVNYRFEMYPSENSFQVHLHVPPLGRFRAY